MKERAREDPLPPKQRLQDKYSGAQFTTLWKRYIRNERDFPDVVKGRSTEEKCGPHICAHIPMNNTEIEVILNDDNQSPLNGQKGAQYGVYVVSH